MKNTIILLALLLSFRAAALDWTYSTNLFYALTYPTNIYIGTDATDGATNGDSFQVWGNKINADMNLGYRWRLEQVDTNAWLSSRIGTNETTLAGGITTNITFEMSAITNTLYFTNGILKRVTSP